MKSIVIVSLLFFAIATHVFGNNSKSKSKTIETCAANLTLTDPVVASKESSVKWRANTVRSIVSIAKRHQPNALGALDRDLNSIKATILRDPYLEMNLRPTEARALAAQCLGVKDLNTQMVEDLFAKAIDNNLKLYREMRDPTPYLGEIDLEDKKIAVRDDGRLITTYTVSNLSYRKILDVTTMLRDKWPRASHPRQVGKVQTVLMPVQDFPGIFIFIVNDLRYLNHLFDRISSFVEREKVIRVGDNQFGTNASGHDLRSEDILEYIQSANSNPNFYKSSNQEEQLRLDREREFIDRTLLPLIQKNPKSVILAVASDQYTRLVLSHEFIHAQYFLNPILQKGALEFWNKKISQQDRETFKKMVGSLYNTEDVALMSNEFLAYTFQTDGFEGDRHQFPEMLPMIKRYKVDLMEYLRSMGTQIVL